jgi:hypothetical protein
MMRTLIVVWVAIASVLLIQADAARSSMVVPASPAGWTATAPDGIDAAQDVLALDCPKAGWCTAIARTVSSQGEIYTESAGVWSAASFPAAPDSPQPIQLFLAQLKCPAIGECVAFTTYSGADSSRYYSPYVLEEHAGRWSAQPAPAGAQGGLIDIDSLSCAAPGVCIAGGEDRDTRTPVIVAKTDDGGWTASPAPRLPGHDCTANEEIYRGIRCTVTALSCPGAGECVGIARGAIESQGPQYTVQSPYPYSIRQILGNWIASPLPSTGTDPRYQVPAYVDANQVECPQPARCMAAGGAFAFKSDAIDGWPASALGLPSLVDGTGSTRTASLSCPSLSSCVVGGFSNTSGVEYPGVAYETEAGWQALAPAASTLSPFYSEGATVDCAAPGECVAAAYASPSAVFYVEHGGVWSQVAVPRPGVIGDLEDSYGARSPMGLSFLVSCPAVNSCTVVDTYQHDSDKSGPIVYYQGGPIWQPGSDDPPPNDDGGSANGGNDGPLTVITASAPPSGVAVHGVTGAQTTLDLEHGLCDPGSDTNWLHTGGLTFVCILSGDVWDDPDLISAKKRCIINLGLTFIPFTKAAKLPKYFRDVKKMEFSLETVSAEIGRASYPEKAARDEKLVSGLETTIESITDPQQAILTFVSSNRVLDSLIAKLGRGSAQAHEVAADLAVAQATVKNVLSIVTGAQDISDCVKTFTAK